MSGQKYTFHYGSPETNHYVDVTDIVYRRHVVRNKVKFSADEDLDVYFGDPVPGLPKQLQVRPVGSLDVCAFFWQRAPILFSTE